MNHSAHIFEKNHLCFNQLAEIDFCDYIYFAFNLFPDFKTFRDQEDMDSQVTQYCTVKNLRAFLKKYNVEPLAFDCDSLWEQVKEVIKENNQTASVESTKLA